MKGRSLVAAALAQLLFFEDPTAADFKKSFVAGYRAFEREKWEDVERYMAEAIQENPTDSSVEFKVTAVSLKSYIPHFYLGLARSRLGRCEGALEAWSVFSSTAQFHNLEEFKSLPELRRPCLAKIGSARFAKLEMAVAGLDERFSRMASRPERQQLADSWDTNKELGPAESDVVRLRQDIARDLLAARGATDPQQLDGLESKIGVFSDRVDQLDGSIRRAVLEKSAAPPVAVVARVESGPAVTEESVAVGTPVSAELRRVASMYFAGEYEDSLAIASGLQPRAPVEKLQLSVFQAAAHHALASLEPNSARIHLTAAAIQIQAVKKAKPDYRPSSRFFCPAFLQFWLHPS